MVFLEGQKGTPSLGSGIVKRRFSLIGESNHTGLRMVKMGVSQKYAPLRTGSTRSFFPEL